MTSTNHELYRAGHKRPLDAELTRQWASYATVAEQRPEIATDGPHLPYDPEHRKLDPHLVDTWIAHNAGNRIAVRSITTIEEASAHLSELLAKTMYMSRFVEDHAGSVPLERALKCIYPQDDPKDRCEPYMMIIHPRNEIRAISDYRGRVKAAERQFERFGMILAPAHLDHPDAISTYKHKDNVLKFLDGRRIAVAPGRGGYAHRKRAPIIAV